MIFPQTILKSLAKNSAAVSAVKALAKLEIITAGELLFYFPARYLDFSKFTKIREAKAGETVTIRAKIKSIGARFSFRTRKSLCEAVVSDASGSLKVIWFNQGYLAKTLKAGQEILLSGRVDQFKGLQMVNPVHEVLTEENIHTGRIVPIYKVTEGLYHRTIRTLVKSCLPAASQLEDLLPEEVSSEHSLLSLAQALENIHFPEDDKKLELAKYRFGFEEAFIQQLAVARHKALLAKQEAPKIPQDIDFVKSFLKKLPFELTLSQKKALWDILQDLESALPMNRLLEGDVGSGKTLVAVASALAAAQAKFQSALLAPTEILARQHYETFSKYAHIFKFNTALLSNNFQLINNKPLGKKQVIEAISSGEVDIAVGTHALLEQNLAFKNLAFVTVDEQHRFGVGQRSFLLKNTRGKGKSPHLLSMSATPIPRTLALAVYEDLKISTIKEKPAGRQSVNTSVVPENKRSKAYDFIKAEIKSGRQAFIVTARVEEDETVTTKSAKAEVARLQREIFPGLKIGLIHGKMKGDEKDAVMSGFNDRALDILVATSVIEIGIDVPNASVMVIEDAENFGLAQLHQLRGRVGRGNYKSYCLLFTATQSQAALERLQSFSKITDGFKLAELDMQQRGFGSLFGTEQTGFSFRFARYLTFKVLGSAKQAAKGIIARDPELKHYPSLKTKTDPLIEQIHLE